MTVLRLIPLPLHSALEMLTGLLLMVAPFIVGTSVAGMVAGVAIGALLVGLALQAVEAGPGPAPGVAAHHAADVGVVLGMAGAAIVLSFQDTSAAALFAGAALVQLALNLTTRYSRR